MAKQGIGARLMLKKNHPWVMLASVYMTQYIGLAFMFSAAVAILRQKGVDLDKLALVNLAALPLVGKILYAPVIDKFRLYFKGQYRSWLVFANAGMVVLLLTIATMDIIQQFSEILIVLGIYTFFMSVQDVSVDGLSCKLFSQEERKYASSIQFSGNLLGNIVGGGVLLIFYPWLEWKGSFFILAGLTAVALMQVIFYKEPEGDDRNIQPVEGHLLNDIKHFIINNKSWFTILALYPFIATWGFALLNPILVDNHWSLQDIGFAMKVFGSVVGVLSAAAAAPLIVKIGRNSAFSWMLCLQAVALFLMLFPAHGYAYKPLVYLAIAIHFISFPSLLVI